MFNIRKKIIIALSLIIVINMLFYKPNTYIKATSKNKSQLEDELKKKKNELERNKNKIETLENKKTDIENNIKNVQKEIDKLNNQIISISNEIGNLEIKINILNSDIAKLKKSIKENEDMLALKQQELAENLKYSYINSVTFNYLEIFLNSNSISDFIRKVEIINNFINKKTEIMNEIETRTKELEKEKKDLENKSIELTTLKISKEKILSQLRFLENQKEQEINNLKIEKNNLENKIEDIMDISEQLEQQIKQLIIEIQKYNEQQNNKSYSKEGNFIKPTYGVLTSKFGMRFHPIYKVWKMHKGIDIANKLGTPIYASKSGIVIFTGYLNGYGYTVIIDHGDNFSTLYAHCKTLLVNEGQIVKQGQQIAEMGSTGASTGPHLHFEIRINGEQVDPLNYIDL